ncbi:selenite/tellurite reduction operon b-type cytochrome iron-sulfur cluster-binding subunit ExtO [Seleniivibrio woodruffii]|nr:selenite/tellurite reduction operon b-type cytochrome iron-sulfur cluster-binding subunit ExtO [Seleniivibrio woodruffii]
MAAESRTMLFFLILCISLCFTESGFALDKNDKNCAACHKVTLTGAHKAQKCESCHARNADHFDRAADFSKGAAGCLNCHREYAGITDSAMVHRSAEKVFVSKSFERYDGGFWDKNCKNCHVQSCSDCHRSENPHSIKKPSADDCQECHRDYYTGIEYSGLGQREDHERYQRGREHKGGKYASMLKDVHFEKGMQCGDCHSMKSLAEGRKFSKTCTDCHQFNKNSSVEHSIPEHGRMECYTCHSAWANQEYGTFWIYMRDTKFSEYFRWVKRPHLDYAKSSHTKQYADFPIGVNERKKYSPLRPQFIGFVTRIEKDRVIGKENEMVSSDFRAVFPHTVRRETVLCESCHADNRRLMRERMDERIYHTDRDGLPFPTFYNGKWFSVTNGRFVNDSEFKRIKSKGAKYNKALLKKWQQVTKTVENSKK